MLEEENQMGLFEVDGAAPDTKSLDLWLAPPPPARLAPALSPATPAPAPARSSAKPASVSSSAKPAPARSSAQPAPGRPAAKTGPARTTAKATPARPSRKAAPARPAKTAAKKAPTPVASAPTAKAVSGLVPVGDVRLTANIRQDLHLKLKIASAHRRTTIGEIIEELIVNYL
jgi:hypothetical protein